MDFYGNPTPPPSSNSSHLDCFPMDDLLDFSNDAVFAPNFYSADHSSHLLPPSLPALYDHTSTDTFHSYPYPVEFNHQLSLPIDDVDELEWLSHFVDDSCADVPRSAGLAGAAAMQPSASGSKSRSKRPEEGTRELEARPAGARRCTHCASEKTPQWRTGPLGPKTLCNACGVRFKSGRLVPEYRPASSPTFVLTQHSNSHRKVLELRRQKELLRQQNQSLGRC